MEALKIHPSVPTNFQFGFSTTRSTSAKGGCFTIDHHVFPCLASLLTICELDLEHHILLVDVPNVTDQSLDEGLLQHLCRLEDEEDHLMHLTMVQPFLVHHASLVLESVQLNLP